MTTTISSVSDQQQQNGPNNFISSNNAHNVFPVASNNAGPTVDSAGYLEPIALGNPRHAEEVARTQHSYVNSCTQCGQPHPPPCVDVNTNYAKLDDLLKQEAGAKRRDQQHFYVNVFTGGSDAQQTQQQPPQHSYANLSCPASPDRATVSEEDRQVNYVVLDLDHRSDSSTSVVSPVTTSAPNGVPATASQPSSPLWAPEGYATIDFDRTAALSNSANPSALTHDDSIRKTRHNSTVVPVLS
uniref:Putative fibroblast growth factor receptor substrate 2 n=1 Tax=Ornithodoros turicata TaxID=34597 RepID=A0A2R5L9N0_9ACAR